MYPAGCHHGTVRASLQGTRVLFDEKTSRSRRRFSGVRFHVDRRSRDHRQNMSRQRCAGRPNHRFRSAVPLIAPLYLISHSFSFLPRDSVQSVPYGTLPIATCILYLYLSCSPYSLSYFPSSLFLIWLGRPQLTTLDYSHRHYVASSSVRRLKTVQRQMRLTAIPMPLSRLLASSLWSSPVTSSESACLSCVTLCPRAPMLQDILLCDLHRKHQLPCRNGHGIIRHLGCLLRVHYFAMQVSTQVSFELRQSNVCLCQFQCDHIQRQLR